MKKDFEEKIVFNQMIEELKDFKNEKLYRCPYCEKIIEWDDANYNPEENTFTCPLCNETYDETELECISIYDYIEEMYLTYKSINKEN